jgi:electron transfer flavoprotein alpha subunit
MKLLLICEYREGKLLNSSYELLAFAEKLGADRVALVVGTEADLPKFDGLLYLADVEKYGEYNPDLHKKLVLEVVRKEKPDYVVFLHSSYGWDLAPRVAVALQAGQVSEVVALVEGKFEVSLCNGKLRRTVIPKGSPAVLTIQAGAFNFSGELQETPQVEKIESCSPSGIELLGY